jgi:hypothetical protein
MNKKAFISLVMIALALTLLISACGNSKRAATTEPPQVIIITATPEEIAPPVVATEPPAAPPTEPPDAATGPTPFGNEPTPFIAEDSAQGERYFLDEFDNGLDQYDHFIFDRSKANKIYKENEELEKKIKVELEDGTIEFSIERNYLYYYMIYRPQVYEDVKISVEVENLGFPASQAALVCRYDEELGWYELIVSNTGRWRLYYFDKPLVKWNFLSDGGAEKFHYGKDTNKYTLECKGKELSVYINDVFSQTVTNKNLKKGKVGFSIQAPKSWTTMNVPWFEVSEP